MMTETKLTITEIKQYDNVVNVPSFMDIADEAMKEFGISNARKVGPCDPAGGSTDFGTASSQIPSLIFGLPVAPANVSGHSREYAIATKSPQGNEALVNASKIMAYLAIASPLSQSFSPRSVLIGRKPLRGTKRCRGRKPTIANLELDRPVFREESRQIPNL